MPGLLINAWYLDDGTLCGSPHDLREALDIIEEDGSACGLHLNGAKSLLFVPLALFHQRFPSQGRDLTSWVLQWFQF